MTISISQPFADLNDIHIPGDFSGMDDSDDTHSNNNPINLNDINKDVGEAKLQSPDARDKRKNKKHARSTIN